MIHSKQAPFAATLGIGCKKGKTMSKFDTGASQKTAFLTGASSGIGKAAALSLIKEGYRVIGTSRSTKPDELRDGIRMIACDVTSDESVAAAVALARAELGHIDLLVNNAGFGVTGAAEESSVARVHALFDTNFYGVVRMHQCGAADHAPTRTWPDSEYRLDTGAGSGPLRGLLFGQQICHRGLFRIAGP